MDFLPLLNSKRVVCVGIGGGDVSRVALFFKYIGSEVVGFDHKETDRTKFLETKKIKITYINPEGALPKCDCVIYSDALPDAILSNIKGNNKEKLFIEVGDFIRFLVSEYEKAKLNKVQGDAFTLAEIAPLFEFKPEKLKLIGVTGTDGKTTVSSMIAHMLRETGYKPGLITTVSAKIGSRELDTGLHVTTPGSKDIMKYLELMKQEQCTHAIMECTSQGIYMGRLAGLKFDCVVYTNITQDHLGYHKTWENYAKAKAMLAELHLKTDGVVIINKDDKGCKILKNLKVNSRYYTLKSAKNSEKTMLVGKVYEKRKGLTLLVSNLKYDLPFYGKFNGSNILASTLCVNQFGISTDKAIKSLTTFKNVRGRMQFIQEDPFAVIVDFAHTPNGLLNALKTAKKLKKRRGKLTVVFGCAAKRDEYKRPIMGAYAKKYADITILTAEDSRMEGLKVINDQIEAGWNKQITKGEKHLFRFDYEEENVQVRRDAIGLALQMAKKGDVVLITGKGHEQSLCFGFTEYPWDDVEETITLLKEVVRI